MDSHRSSSDAPGWDDVVLTGAQLGSLLLVAADATLEERVAEKLPWTRFLGSQVLFFGLNR